MKLNYMPVSTLTERIIADITKQFRNSELD